MMPTSLYFVVLVGAAIPAAWYFYQIGSRKKSRIRYKLKQMILFMIVYFVTITFLTKQGLQPGLAVAVISALVGIGSAWLLIPAPKTTRRIPKAVRRAVIARDLESKGLKWDPARHHIDHVVPFSRGGDNSPRNLRVMEKQKNLSKGGKMPGVRDFLKR